MSVVRDWGKLIFVRYGWLAELIGQSLVTTVMQNSQPS